MGGVQGMRLEPRHKALSSAGQEGHMPAFLKECQGTSLTNSGAGSSHKSVLRFHKAFDQEYFFDGFKIH